MRRSIKIKNCGLNSADAVGAAVASGADFLGFIDYPASPRHVTPGQVGEWLTEYPDAPSRVLVTVNATNEIIQSHVDAWKPTHLQLHGDESIKRIDELKAAFALPIIKAIAIEEKSDLQNAKLYAPHVDFLLFDTKAPAGEVSGGTGRSFDWSILKGATFDTPVFLSGGINLHNIEEALGTTGVSHIDISSGLESSRGVKDPLKINAFNEKVRHL